MTFGNPSSILRGGANHVPLLTLAAAAALDYDSRNPRRRGRPGTARGLEHLPSLWLLWHQPV